MVGGERGRAACLVWPGPALHHATLRPTQQPLLGLYSPPTVTAGGERGAPGRGESITRVVRFSGQGVAQREEGGGGGTAGSAGIRLWEGRCRGGLCARVVRSFARVWCCPRFRLSLSGAYDLGGRYKATWKRGFKLPWREAGTQKTSVDPDQ